MTNEELLRVIEEAKASEATMLDLSDKGLTILPSEICCLTSLTWLNLDRNQLTVLPPELFQLTDLKKLYLYDNQLKALPPEIDCLTNLIRLDLDHNQLTALPMQIGYLTNLAALHLSHNQLTALPPEIVQLTKLEIIRLDGNPLISPPPEITYKGIEAICRYFSELEKSTQQLNEVKTLLIGDGAAGKTSLVKQLLGEAFDPHEDTTHGISIRGWEQEANERKIRINIWDFGGQEIQHATHQFFFSKRSLYVLVLDGRKDERTEYWLRHVEAFGGDSPVLIVLNKHDANPSFDVNRPFLMQKYPGIRRFFRTSCKSGEGIAKFKETLLEELAGVDILETLWSGSWFQVKQSIEDMNAPYISSEEYGSICQASGIADEKHCETIVHLGANHHMLLAAVH